MSAIAQLKEGRLTEALGTAMQAVKSKPGDASARWLLAEALCYAGDLARADLHLDAIMSQDPALALNLAEFRQLIRAERARQEFFEQGRLPELLEEPDEETRLRFKASLALREGNTTEAASLLEEAESRRVAVRGTLDGRAFDDLRDLDDLTASILEVLTSNGKYYWVPFARIESLTFEPPARPRDLLWRRARMLVRDGTEANVHVPALYAGSHVAEDDACRLGRRTDWLGGDSPPARGVGQRMLLVGDRDEPIGAITSLTIGAHEGV